MLTTAGLNNPRLRHAPASRKKRPVKAFTMLLVSIVLLALVALAIAIGVHAFLAAVGHYGPWEQIWAGVR
jgi:hypothetical protein